jgi:hypothetical protein
MCSTARVLLVGLTLTAFIGCSTTKSSQSKMDEHLLGKGDALFPDLLRGLRLGMTAKEAKKSRPRLRFDKPLFFGLEAPALRQRSTELERLLSLYYRTKRKRSAVEAPESLTNAYVELIFAYGFARLGRSARANQLRERARAALPADDPIHAFLSRAYSARVKQALDGQLIEAPLPPAIAQRLNTFRRFLRYKVDRLRQSSLILEPHERLDPVLGFQQAKRDPRGEDVAQLRGTIDQRRLTEHVTRMMDRALDAATPPDERARVFDVALDFLPRIPRAEAVKQLRRLTNFGGPATPAARCELLEEAVLLAGYFRDEALVKELLQRAEAALGDLAGDQNIIAGRKTRAASAAAGQQALMSFRTPAATAA